MTQTLEFTQAIQATPEAVYEALTAPATMTQWLCQDARVQAQEGGQLYLYWHGNYYATGSFEQIEPAQALIFSWRSSRDQYYSKVHITLTKLDDGTQLALTHREIADEETLEETKQGWEEALVNLKSLLETGLDKRVYDKPFLGFLPQGQLDADQSKALGLPTEGAVLLGGVLPETAASRAGLQSDDYVTRLGDVPIVDFVSVGRAMASRAVGEAVSVEFYRAGQKHTTLLTLTRRPAPDVPAMPAQLAQQLQQTYAALDRELDEIFENVSEESAQRPPAASEWNAKQVVAHLLVTERVAQVMIGSKIGNSVFSGWPSNDPPLLEAILAIYPTLSALVAAWKSAEAETVALVQRLPAQLVGRRFDYLQLGQLLLLFLPSHTKGHYQQIREALAESVAAV